MCCISAQVHSHDWLTSLRCPLLFTSSSPPLTVLLCGLQADADADAQKAEAERVVNALRQAMDALSLDISMIVSKSVSRFTACFASSSPRAPLHSASAEGEAP